MRDLQILSTFQELAPAPARPVPAPLFDACHVGVALRAVLFVELVVGVAAMFGAAGFSDWVSRLSLLTGSALPATLVWLIACCGLGTALAPLRAAVQQLLAVLLGAAAGVGACGVLYVVGLQDPAPWLACASAGALLAALLVAALVLRERSKTPVETRARLSELQSRIRPHFLFNTLNTAIALVRAEPAKAEAMLEDLSDLFRHALLEQRASVTVADETALAQRYLAIEQVRFGDRIRVEWSLDPAAEAARLPPLLLQPLLENAVKHGVEPSADGAQLRISTERRGSRVVIKIANTVPAGQGEPGSGLALDNVRERLNLLHDLECQFRSSLKDAVFQVRIEVPA
ncbi:MAG: sensor histidine kinase [Rhodoferax sp.]